MLPAASGRYGHPADELATCLLSPELTTGLLCRSRRVHGLGGAVAMYLGLALYSGAALAQDAQGQGAKPTELTVDAPARFQTWRKITLGTYKGVNAYRDALDAAGIKIGDSADEILGRPAFRYAGVKTEVELTLLSAATLGVESEAALADVYKRARQAGLELCPAEVGPQLRLDYRNQPLGEALNIAMEPIATYGGQPTILSLMNFGSGLALIGGDGRSDFMVPRTFLFVFALPPNGRLEAARDPRNVPPN
jgi:hypothetical protein